jgi:SHS family sialic acid transporter-like MFS transporter
MRVSDMGDPASQSSPARIYWTAFIGLLFDYYDLYLFVYLEKELAAQFALTLLGQQCVAVRGPSRGGGGGDHLRLAGRPMGPGAGDAGGVWGLCAGHRRAQPRLGLLQLCSGFRLLASLALGAEWGISHTYLAERVDRATRYRFAALLQFAILGGLLAALARNYLLPAWGWRWLFAASIAPVVLLSLARWSVLAKGRRASAADRSPK